MWCETFRGGLGRPESRRGGVARDSWPGLAAQVARGPPHRQDGRERRDAPYVTHSAFWRAGAQNVRENVTCFEHQEKKPNVAHESDREIRYAHQCFVNVSALERTMLPMTRSTF